MGQYWTFINIDKQEILCPGAGKLGEFIFDGRTPRELLRRIETSFWDGDRVACVGDYATIEDFPCDVLPQGEDDEEEDSEGEEEGDESRKYKTNVWAATDRYYRTTNEIDYERLRNKMIARFGTADSSKLTIEQWAEYAKLRDEEEELYKTTKDQFIVVRNLDKHEYIRGDVVVAANVGSISRHARDVGLGEALMMRICWSWDSSCAMNLPKDMQIHRGAWVGDRIDTAPLEDPPEEIAAAWRDITLDVIEDLRVAWEGEYGRQG